MSSTGREAKEKAKKLIKEKMKADAAPELRRTLDEMLEKGTVKPGDSHETVAKAMKESTRVADVLKVMTTSELEAPSAAVLPPAPGAVSTARRVLTVKVLCAKDLLEDAIAPRGHDAPALEVDVQFQSQRAKSRSVAASRDPVFGDSLAFEIKGNAARKSLLSVSSPVHLVLLKRFSDGTSNGVGSSSVEWRRALRGGGTTISAEIVGSIAGAGIPVGIVDIRLELDPPLPEDAVVTEEAIAAQVEREKQQRLESTQAFFSFSKQWWSEYRSINTTCSLRIVKLFAQSELGGDLPVVTFVRPMGSCRLVDSPAQAARFVGLFPANETEESVGSSVWKTAHTVLSTLRGGPEDRACLLCSLMLGFGLEAYVAIGKAEGGGHSWVMTVGDGGTAVFWEPLTGARYDPKRKCPYLSIDCVFNHESFFANVQPMEDVQHTSLDLLDQHSWKAMSRQEIFSIARPVECLPPLLPNLISHVFSEEILETELRSLVTQHRRGLGFATDFDEGLSSMLRPMLWTYEQERLTGLQLSGLEFQQAIKRNVPDGHTFKGFPAVFSHRNGGSIFASFVRSPVASIILQSHGDRVRFAVHVRCFPYPEGLFATWVMLAVRYIEVATSVP